MPLLFALAFGTAFALFEGWVLMLLIGALHSHVPAIPAIGFSASMLLVFLLSVVGWVIGGGRKA